MKDLTKEYQALWTKRGKKIGIKIKVTKCPYSKSQIEALEKEGRSISFLPKELSTQSSRDLLGKIFPLMKSWSLGKDNACENEEDRYGWFDYEDSRDAPYLNTTENELKLKRQVGQRGMNLNEYIVASQDTKKDKGYYLDEATWSRLLGSRREGGVVDARFLGDGDLYVLSYLDPRGHYGYLGGRLVGVPSSLSFELPKKSSLPITVAKRGKGRKPLKTIIVEIKIYEK